MGMIGQQLPDTQGSPLNSEPPVRLSHAVRCKGMKKSGNDKKVAKNVATALAEVPIDNKQERDASSYPVFGEFDPQ